MTGLLDLRPAPAPGGPSTAGAGAEAAATNKPSLRLRDGEPGSAVLARPVDSHGRSLTTTEARVLCRAGVGAELPSAVLGEGGAHEEGGSALLAGSLDGSVTLAVDDHEPLAVSDAAGVRSVGVAPVTSWHKVGRVVVPNVPVDVIRDESDASRCRRPRHRPVAPVASMSARTDLGIEHLPMGSDLDRSSVLRQGTVASSQRVIHRHTNRPVASHASYRTRYKGV